MKKSEGWAIGSLNWPHMSEGSNTFPPTQLRITWKANMDSDSSSDDDCQVIRAVSFVKCCFCYLKMFCKTVFSLLKITGVTYLKPGTKRSGKIEVSALHFPAKGTIACIFVSQEKGKIDYICIQAILKLTVFIWESCTCQLFSEPNAWDFRLVMTRISEIVPATSDHFPKTSEQCRKISEKNSADFWVPPKVTIISVMW